MNVLYYFEPWIELSRPHLRYHNLRYQLGPQIRALKTSSNGINIKIAIGEGTLHKCQAERYDLEGCDYIVLTREELKQFHPNYLSASVSLFNGDQPSSQHYARYLGSKLGDFVPDVVISFLAPLPDLTSVWPNVATIYAEFGIFSRAPYPRTFYFDQQGMFYRSSIQTNASQLLSAEVSQEDLDLLRDFRKRFVSDFYKKRPILDQELITASARFERKLLLPLQFSAYFGFDCCANYTNQFEFLTDVLDTIPNDIGVFVTEHNGWPEVITEHNIKYLRDRYPNLLWSPRLSKIRSSSQYLLAEVDGVVTVSSSVGLQCMMWDKPLFSPWKSHLAGYSQVGTLNDISIEKIDAYIPGTYDRALVWLLTRYYMTEKYAYDAKHFVKYLKQAVKNRNATTLQDRFIPLGASKDVFGALRDAFREGDGHTLYLQDLGEELESVVTAEETLVPAGFRKALDNVDVVSFDIFDTLVDRPFAAPHELFLYMQEKVRALVNDPTLEFHKLRRLAEHRVRQNCGRNEVTIEEIYDHLLELAGIPQSFRNTLIELEFENEILFCRKKKAGEALYKYALNEGKKVICVSDFYYGRAYIERLLVRLRYTELAAIHVSADFLESKKEGKLFAKAKATSQLDPKRTLHVGDNYQSDIVNAGHYGFKTYWIQRSIEALKEQPLAKQLWVPLIERSVFPTDRAQLGQSLFFGLIARRQFDQPLVRPRTSIGSGDPRQLGYTMLGPLLFAFTQWLINRVQKKGADKVFFLSRDGRLLHRSYELFRSFDGSLPDGRYLLSSRRAYSLASIRSVADAQNLASIPFEPTELEKIIQSRFGITLTDDVCTDEMLDAADLRSSTVRVHPIHDLIRLKKLVALLFAHIEKRASVERDALIEYLRSEQFLDAKNPAIVDIGYAGTIQSYLTNLTGNKRITGHYVMTHAKAEEYIAEGMDIAGYLKENVEHHLKRDLISLNISLFELLFSSDEPSLSHFERAVGPAEVTVTAITKNHHVDPVRNNLVSAIQKGALEFVEDVMSYLGPAYNNVYLSRDFASFHLEHFIRNPAREDAKLFNNVSAEDQFSGRDTRYVVADIVTALEKKTNLTKAEAQALLEKSDWQNGARAILPAPTNTAAVRMAKPGKKTANGKHESTVLQASIFARPIRLYRKFRRDPYQYFSDSSIPAMRGLKHFFK